MNEFSFRRRAPHLMLSGTVALAATGLLAACQAELAPPGGMTMTPSGSSSTGSGGSATTAAAGTTDGTTPSSTSGGVGTTGFDSTPVENCTGSTLGAPKRMVRLTYNQLASSVKALFGDELTQQIKTTFEIGSLSDRDFPPLSSPREGSLFIDSVWRSTDAIAKRVGQHVFDNFATVTGCTDPPSAECAQTYLADLAERAFRRPLTEREWTRLLQVFTETQTATGTVQQATQFTTYAIMQSPHFVYRTEFGTNVYAEEVLAPYELASQLSYFLTDGPPDDELLLAAESGQLTTQEDLRLQADRLLATPAARENLQAAVFAYFEIPSLSDVVIDPGVAPDFTEGLRNSMYRETELFINHALWNGPLGNLLTSRTTFVNENLANLYGIAYPPAGSAPDADGFAQVELDANRAGLLTNPGFLTARSRPDVPSVVGRGILVNATVLCAEVPVFPENLAEVVAEADAMFADSSEREKADYRMKTPPCSNCHTTIDPYGLALDNFDVIGKYRATDPQGRQIDASVTLPDGTVTTTVPDLANHVVVSGQFATCMAKHMIDYALAMVSVDIPANSCAVKAVMDKFNTTPQTFSDLVREIAASATMAVRSPGGMQ